MVITELLGKVNQYILNPIITLAFAIALLVFFWGIFQFVASETGDKEREKGKSKIIYGILGMFVMLSAVGIIGVILKTFNISNAGSTYIGL
ncbi:MAG: hypothetical protein AAB780_00585 [Patescibacteria group bacterium]